MNRNYVATDCVIVLQNYGSANAGIFAPGRYIVMERLESLQEVAAACGRMYNQRSVESIHFPTMATLSAQLCSSRMGRSFC